MRARYILGYITLDVLLLVETNNSGIVIAIAENVVVAVANNVLAVFITSAVIQGKGGVRMWAGRYLPYFAQ
ncbi:hypothetical protein PMIN04_012735 [Paraphaeosphaeria minitans]